MPDELRIRHETIYTALYAMPRGELRRQILEVCRAVTKADGRAALAPISAA
jgi:IS30 family transposase